MCLLGILILTAFKADLIMKCKCLSQLGVSLLAL